MKKAHKVSNHVKHVDLITWSKVGYVWLHACSLAELHHFNRIDRVLTDWLRWLYHILHLAYIPYLWADCMHLCEWVWVWVWAWGGGGSAPPFPCWGRGLTNTSFSPPYAYGILCLLTNTSFPLPMPMVYYACWPTQAVPVQSHPILQIKVCLGLWDGTPGQILGSCDHPLLLLTY